VVDPKKRHAVARCPSPRPPRGRRCCSTATTATTAATSAAFIVATAAAAIATNCHSRRSPRLPAPRPAASKSSLLSFARVPSTRGRASFLPPCSPPAASLATQSPPCVPPPAGLGHASPHPAYAHASAALAWQAVVVQMSVAAGSRGGARQVANSRVAFCRVFRLRCLLRSEAGLACCVCGGVECASRARSRVVLCVWR
jgi:hypothetical protein